MFKCLQGAVHQSQCCIEHVELYIESSYMYNCKATSVSLFQSDLDLVLILVQFQTCLSCSMPYHQTTSPVAPPSAMAVASLSSFLWWWCTSAFATSPIGGNVHHPAVDMDHLCICRPSVTGFCWPVPTTTLCHSGACGQCLQAYTAGWVNFRAQDLPVLKLRGV